MNNITKGLAMMIIGIVVGIVTLIPNIILTMLSFIEAKIFPEEATHRPFTWLHLRLAAFVLWVNRLFDPEVTVKDFFTSVGLSDEVAEIGQETHKKEWDETEF